MTEHRSRQRDGGGHVALVSSNYWPEPTGIAVTTTEFAEYMARQGLDVRVATALPYYPEWSIPPEYAGRLWLTEERHGVRIHRSWHRVHPNPTSLTRMLHEFSLSLFGLPNVVRVTWRARTVFIVSPDLSYAFTASVIAAVLRVRRVLIVQDLMPDAAVELGMLKNKAMIRFSRWLARRAYALAHEVHTIGHGMKRRIVSQCARPDKVRWVPNTIDADELAPVEFGVNEFRRHFVRAGTLAVMHTGNMGKKQDLRLLLRTARRFADDGDVHFFVFGDGAVKDDFLATKAEWDLDNVSHYPLQERRLLRHMLSGADIVLVSQLDEVVDIVVPSKMLTAMAAGAMIVAACNDQSETAQLVRDSRGGMVIPSGDDTAFMDVIRKVKNGEIDVELHRRNVRRYATRCFDRKQVLDPLVEELRAFCSTT